MGPSTAGFIKALAAAGLGRSGHRAVSICRPPPPCPPRNRRRSRAWPCSPPLSPGVRGFVESYRAHTGLTPTQRSFFVYEAVLLAVDAIRRAGTDTPEAVEAALKTTAMPSLLGGTYAMDDHNHPHTPLSILGIRDGKPAVIATE